MRSFRATVLPLTAIALLALLGATWCLADDEDKEQEEATVISLAKGKIELQAPAEWEVKEPQSRIVEFEFSIPPLKEDENPVRVTIMGAGGGVEANVQRWIDQFEQPDGSDTKEKANIEKKDINDTEVHIVSITGIYKDRPGGGPFTQTPVVLREDYRMLSAIIVTKKSGHYYIKMYGPQGTVDAQEEAFHKMLETLSVKAED